MKKVLIDTDILIDFLRGKEIARNFLSGLLDEYTSYCSTITVAEIYAGMKEQERAKTDALINSLNIIDVTYKIAEKAGIYKRNEKRQFLELDDCIIAATAFIQDAVLATGNLRHYPMEDIVKITTSQRS